MPEIVQSTAPCFLEVHRSGETHSLTESASTRISAPSIHGREAKVKHRRCWKDMELKFFNLT